MLNADSPFAAATRSIYLGNLPLDCAVRDICDLVRGERGIESVRLLPAKSCAFVDFISRNGAERFIARVRKNRSRPQIKGQDIKLGWAKEKPMQPTVVKALENGATRNVYLSLPPQDPSDPLLAKFNDYLMDSDNISTSNDSDYSDYFNPPSNTEISSMDYPLVSFLYGIFDEFGPLDMIKVVPSRRIAFIHMGQVADAMRAVAELATRPEFKGKRLAFGRDRCGERLETPVTSNSESFDYSNDSIPSVPGSGSMSISVPSRTVYLGSCSSPEIDIEDICDHIHTGQLQSVRLNRDRKCAFVTFISAEAAELFLGRALQFGLNIKNCQIKPAFAKENSPGTTGTALPMAISNALRKGYTRNLYLGNIDFSVLTEPRLRTEMSRFGPLDRIQLLKDRGVAFVHFANLLDGGRAFEQIKSDPCYKNCRVGFGRDRCEPQSRDHSQVNPAYYYPAPPPQYNPLYFHPMMYDPANIIYHPQPLPINMDYPPVPYHVQSNEEYSSSSNTNANTNTNNNNTSEPDVRHEYYQTDTNSNQNNNNNKN